MADDIAPGATSPGKEEARSSSSFVHDFESQLKQIHHLDIWGCAKTEEKVVSRSGFYPIKQQPDSSAMTDANMKVFSWSRYTPCFLVLHKSVVAGAPNFHVWTV